MKENTICCRAFIEKRRKEMKFTQQSLADKIGISRAKYQRDFVDGNVSLNDLIKAGDILKFRVILLPDECDGGIN